jgi:transcriptional regulator with XRE-family HTH domain
MNDGLKHFGQIIRDSRERKNLTQKELSLMMDVSVRTIISLEQSHHNITMEILYKLIQALQISADDILYPGKKPLPPKQNQFINEFSGASPVQQEIIIDIAQIIMRKPK